jgi:hypothetical protein
MVEILNLNTEVRGTIFIKGNEDRPREPTLQIAGNVEVDPNDLGGDGFYLPEK